MLDEEKATSFFIERKKAYRAMVDGIPKRAKLMDWLLAVSAHLNISDEAFFHAVHLAESALTHFHLKQQKCVSNLTVKKDGNS